MLHKNTYLLYAAHHLSCHQIVHSYLSGLASAISLRLQNTLMLLHFIVPKQNRERNMAYRAQRHKRTSFDASGTCC